MFKIEKIAKFQGQKFAHLENFSKFSDLWLIKVSEKQTPKKSYHILSHWSGPENWNFKWNWIEKEEEEFGQIINQIVQSALFLNCKFCLLWALQTKSHITRNINLIWLTILLFIAVHGTERMKEMWLGRNNLWHLLIIYVRSVPKVSSLYLPEMKEQRQLITQLLRISTIIIHGHKHPELAETLHYNKSINLS